MSDNRLGISVEATGTDTAASEIRRLTLQINNLRDSIANLGNSNFAGSSDLAKNLRTQLAGLEAQYKQLATAQVQQYQTLEGFNIRAIAAMRGQADAIKGTSAELAAQDAVFRAGANGGRVLTTTIQEAIAATTGLGTATKLTKAEIAGITEAFGGEVLELTRVMEVADGAAAAVHRVGSPGSAMVGREGRHVMALFDELARGQRGAMVSSGGAMLRDSGMGGAGLMAGMGGLVAIMGGGALLRATEQMAKWAEQVQRGAEASGMSVEDYSKLQGALTLTGMKADAADATLRAFATSIEEATANPASRAAKAFHAIGISQQEIIASGGNMQTMLMRAADAWKQTGDGAYKSAAFQAIFKRGVEELVGPLSKGSDGLKDLEQQSTILGITLDAKTAKAISDVGEKIHMLGATIRGEGIQSFVAWLPTINSAVDDLSRLVSVLGAAATGIGSLNSALSNITGGHGLLDLATPGLYLMHSLENAWDKTAGPRAEATILPDVNVTGRRAVSAFDVPKAGAGKIDKGITSDISALRKELTGLRDDYRLATEQQDSFFDRQKIEAKLQQSDKTLSPMGRANSDVSAAQQSGQAKLAALATFKQQSDAVYDQIIAKAQEVYAKDPKLYKDAVQEKINADKEFANQAQQIQNKIGEQAMEIVNAHKQAVEEVVKAWGAAFDRIGDKIESTIEAAIKSAFIQQKPEYSWTSAVGPHGQPLMVPHRIDPTTQLLGSAGLSIAEDLGKSLASSLTSSLAKSLFKDGSATFGEGLAKMIGIGTPGGLFGSGIGAVSKVADNAVFSTAVATFATAVGVFAGATATAGASAGLSAAGAIGSGASAVGSAGSIFSFISKIFAFRAGGIVPSAAGGMVLPGFGGATPALLHSREMVLPEHISTGLQNMIAGGGAGGGDMHMHFHGPSDGPSIQRWFRENMTKNASAIKDMFRSNALTPRTF